MSPENGHGEKDNYLFDILGISLLAIIATGAFSWKTKQIIKQRDENKSAVSGKTEKLHAAHIDHSKTNPRYDESSNGRLLTAEEHLQDHVNRAGRNGLTIAQNNWAIAQLKKLIGEE
jgi:hypothetical protein